MYPREQEELFKEEKWDLIQVRINPDLKGDIMSWCRTKGMTLSCYTRMVYVRTLENERQMHDPRQLQPIDNAVDDVRGYLPVMKKEHFAKY